MARDFTRTNGANAQAQGWDDFEEERPQHRQTGSWLPLDALDEGAYVATPQLRAMPATKRHAVPQPVPQPQQPEQLVRPTTRYPTTFLKAALAQRTREHAAERKQTAQPGVPVRALGMLGSAVLAALLVYLTVSVTLDWTQVKLNDIQYGRPRTTQIDAFVGHGETEGVPTHFIAMNLNRRVTVLEMPGGDSAKANTLVGPYLFGQGEDLTPVQVSAQDVNGDSKPDLVVSVKNEQIIYLNDGAAFKLITAEQRNALEKSMAEAAPKPAAGQATGPEAGK